MPLDSAPHPESHAGDEPISTRIHKASTPLYVSRIKVYPKAISGFFRRIKWSLLIFCLGLYYIGPWLRWDRGANAPDQALLIDMTGHRAYFFWIEIWPQEVYYLTGLLILGAIGLFLVSSLMGRVWCGYACPQTVWTDLFMWVERMIEGDRNARMKLDQQPWAGAKTIKKIAKHTAWLLIAAATGGAWVLYFTDAPTATKAILTGQASGEMYFFIGLFTTTTYLLAGWAREQVCTYMCPWPRFQAAMFDENTLTVTYQTWRGEPRGKHKAGTDWKGRGDCVDCRQCIAVCPTGIDIRDGAQLECIGCGLCIDACNGIMDKVGRPRSLIAFTTFAAQSASASGAKTSYRLMRPRVILYAALLAVVSAVMLIAFMMRTTLEVSVLRDRAPLFVTLSDGSIRNGYTFKILNKTHEERSFALHLSGLKDASLRIVGGADESESQDLHVTARPDSVASYRIYVSAPRASLASESTPITFELHAERGGGAANYHAVFLGPAK